MNTDRPLRLELDTAGHGDATLDEFELAVPRMECRHVARAVSAAVRDVEGVRTVQVRAGGLLAITGSVTPEAVIGHLRRRGYPARQVR